MIICRIILAVVFIYAAVGKMLDPSKFADSVAGFRILPIWTVNIFAIVLPWVELLCGISLLTGIIARSGGLLLAGLNVVFIVAAASAMARGLSIECGCFTLSRAHDNVGWSLIARDVGFILLCIPIVLHSAHSKTSVSETVVLH
ncbi:MAG: MauE/DoxX family redox-associated membrane protein [Armatimonadota bacterium]|nr:DoxX family membrane protein [bacterium]